MFIALFTTAKSWKETELTTEYYSAIKRKEILVFAIKQMNLEDK